MFGPHFQSEKREGYSGRCYNRHSFRPCLQGVNVSREEGSLAYPLLPWTSQRFIEIYLTKLGAHRLHDKQKVFSTRRVTWGTYHLHGKTGYSGWKIKWFAPFRFTLGTRGFSRVRREFSVLAKGRHIFGCRPKPRAAGHYKDLTETGNRARQVSGTQGTSVWDASENMGCNLRGWHFWIIIWGRWAVSQKRIIIPIFLLFLVC